jgi:hypothetical protein
MPTNEMKTTLFLDANIAIMHLESNALESNQDAYVLGLIRDMQKDLIRIAEQGNEFAARYLKSAEVLHANQS